MIELKFYINEEGDSLISELIMDETDFSYLEETLAKKALSYSLQLNYTDLIKLNPYTVDMGASIIFEEDEAEDNVVFVNLDLSKALKVIGGLNSPSALGAKLVFEMLNKENQILIKEEI